MILIHTLLNMIVDLSTTIRGFSYSNNTWMEKFKQQEKATECIESIPVNDVCIHCCLDRTSLSTFYFLVFHCYPTLVIFVTCDGVN